MIPVKSKKAISALLCCIFLVSLFFGCGKRQEQLPPEEAATERPGVTLENLPEPGSSLAQPEGTRQEEERGFWMSYSEIGQLFIDDSERFYQTLYDSFSLLARQGFTLCIFHARAFADAFYSSSYYPWSAYLCGDQGTAPSFDPLAVAVRACHDAGLKIHAWINPYRVSYNNDYSALYPGNPAARISTADLLITESGIFLDPSSESVRRLVIDGVREIAVNYDVDGIHIDDYFYPDDAGDADAADYESYCSGGGNMSLFDWRRANVNTLVSGIYSAVKAIRPELLFGISPSGRIDINYDSCFADVQRWLTVPGYCDYMVPQIYFGFENTKNNFTELLSEWTALASRSSVKVYIGLALYKSGKADSYAGSDEGVSEWTAHSDIIKRQILFLRQNPLCGGFVVFSFGDLVLYEPGSVKEAEVQGIFSVI